MNFTEIEAELDKLTLDELRRLALRSWTAFVAKEGCRETPHECSEEDDVLLAALDEAIEQADATPQGGYLGNEVRERIGQWTSR